MTDRIRLAVPAHALPGAKPAVLLDAARRTLADADSAASPAGRYGHAHLAALRAAAAVVAARGISGSRRGPVTSTWALLVQVAPELTEWATYFATAASTRAAVDAGIPNQVTAGDADAMVKAARTFVGVVEVGLA